MKNLLSALICLFVVSVATTSAQWANPLTASISFNNPNQTVENNRSYVGALIRKDGTVVEYGQTVFLNAIATAVVTMYSYTGTIEAHASGEYYNTNGLATRVQSDAVRTTAGSTLNRHEGSCYAQNTDSFVWVTGRCGEGSALAQLQLTW
jgi:hypothetical protein